MSSNPYAPLRIEFRSSPVLKRVVVAVCAGAAVCPWLTPLSFPASLALSLFAVAAVAWTWHKRPELGGRPVWLEWDREGQWFWHEGGRDRPVDLLGDTYLSAALVILNFRAARGRRSVVIPRDALDPVTFRRLKVRLRIEGIKPDGAEGMSSPADETN